MNVFVISGLRTELESLLTGKSCMNTRGIPPVPHICLSPVRGRVPPDLLEEEVPLRLVLSIGGGGTPPGSVGGLPTSPVWEYPVVTWLGYPCCEQTDSCKIITFILGGIPLLDWTFNVVKFVTSGPLIWPPLPPGGGGYLVIRLKT